MIRGSVLLTRSGVIGCVRVGELLIVATQDQPVDDASWNDYCQLSAATARRYGAHVGVLSWAPEHGPTAKQRKRLVEEYGEAVLIHKQKRFALLTGSMLMRGVVTAIGWISGNLHVRAFDTHETQPALGWLAEEVRFDQRAAAEALGDVTQALAAFPHRRKMNS